MTERELREALRSVPVAEDARARRARHGARRLRAAAAAAPLGARRSPSPRALLAAVVVAASAGAPGDAVARWVREVLGVGVPHPRPALVRVPGGGRLLVTGRDGAWVVAADGARRRLGDYDGASWSPRGLYVVAWRGGELFAVEPNGQVHWSLARPGPVAAARWSPIDGYRVAYLLRRTLRIVNGDGSGDRRLAAARHVRRPGGPTPGTCSRTSTGAADPRRRGRQRARAVALAAAVARVRARVVAGRAPARRGVPAAAARVRPRRAAARGSARRGRAARRRRRVVAARDA